MAKRVRIALELDEQLSADVDHIVARMNIDMAPLQLTRAGFIREAIRQKVAKLKSQNPDL